MNELEQMCAACEASAVEELALATVVRVDGSAYRRPGARMLIFPDGRRIGSISGGCLEAEVVERARTVVRERHAVRMTFDTRTVEGRLMYDLGCNGAITILIEPLADSRPAAALMALRECAQTRQFGALATLFYTSDETCTGSRLLVVQGGGIGVNSFKPDQATAMEQDLRSWSPWFAAEPRRYCIGNEIIEALIEPVVPPIQLLIAGAGEDVKPLARLGETLGWQVVIGDPRGSLLTRDRFAGPSRLTAASPEGIIGTTAIDSRTAVVLMSHNYPLDLEWLNALVPTPAPYIGLLGPRRRSQQLLQDLQETGAAINRERIYSPVGLDIGSEAPAEVALAVAAEIQAVMSGRAGGYLRERAGALHGHQPEPGTDSDRPFVRTACAASGL